MAQLRSRRLLLGVRHRRPFLADAAGGELELTLHEIAVGPTKFDLPLLTRRGAPAGRIVVSIEMVQRCNLQVSLPDVACRMRSLAQHTSGDAMKATLTHETFALTATLTMEDEESEPLRVDFDPGSLELLDKAQMLMRLPPAADMQVLQVNTTGSSFESESIHLRVWSARASKPKLLGEVWLPVTKVYTPAADLDATAAFSEVLWLHGQRVGRLEGRVRVRNGPRVVQLPGGFFTEHGILPVGPIATSLSREASTAGGPWSADRRSRTLSRFDSRDGRDSAGEGADAPGGLGERRASEKLSMSRIAAARGDDRGGGNVVPDFDGPPKGLEIPREVEALLPLVQSLKKVVLDLSLDLQRTALAPHLAPRSAPGAVAYSRTGAAGAARAAALVPRAVEAGLNGKARANGGHAAGRKSPTDGAAGSGGGGAAGSSSVEVASRRLHFLLGRLLTLLGMSSKESTKAFFYSSSDALGWTQRLMMRLWAYLLQQLDHLPYRHQPATLELLHALMLRGELDCSALLNAPSALMERYRRILWETTAYVVGKLNRKAAPAEVRVFCSQALAIAFFRLPTLRSTLLTIILPPGENRAKHVREWNLPWSLQKTALSEPGAVLSVEDVGSGSRSRDDKGLARAAATAVAWAAGVRPGVENSPGLQAQRDLNGSFDGDLDEIEVAITTRSRELSSACLEAMDTSFGGGGGGGGAGFGGGVARHESNEPSLLPKRLSMVAPPRTNSATIDPWSMLWRDYGLLLSDSTQASQAAAQEVLAERVLAGRYWRERLRKRGHCFFLFLEHWTRHVGVAMCMQPGEEVNWRTVPGASVLFKAFLLEMKQRPLHRWPESMRTCMVALSVEYRNILQVFARILLGRVIARQLRPTLPAIKLLSTCFDSIGDDGTLPKQFSVPLLVKQLELMVDSDHFKVVACALLFLYSHIDRLPEPARLDALRWTHGRFCRLALHWSRVVRSVYLHVVVIKVLHHEHVQAPPPVQRTRTPEVLVPRTSSADAAAGAPLRRRGSWEAHLSEPARAIGAPGTKSSSSSSLSVLSHREIEYAKLCTSYWDSLRALERLVDPSDEAAASLPAVDDGRPAAQRRAYAKFAWQDYKVVQKKYDELRQRVADAEAAGGGGGGGGGGGAGDGTMHALPVSSSTKPWSHSQAQPRT